MHNLESTWYNHSVVLCPSKLHPNHPKYIPLCDLYDIPHSINCNVFIQNCTYTFTELCAVCSTQWEQVLMHSHSRFCSAFGGDRGGLTLQQLQLGLAAMDPATPHGGVAGHIRSQLIFESYTKGTGAMNLAEFRWVQVWGGWHSWLLCWHLCGAMLRSACMDSAVDSVSWRRGLLHLPSG